MKRWILIKDVIKLLAVFLASACAATVLFADSSAWNEAEWIGFTKDGRRPDLAQPSFCLNRMKEPVQRRVYVSSLLRKPFRVDQPVRSASVQVCGLGLHELYLNGDKVSDRVLEPAPTTYDKLSLYSVYDVTANIKQGGNGIGLMLGNGFYGQNFAFTPGLRFGEPRDNLY
jgi:alpha-L-rhamnosidase